MHTIPRVLDQKLVQYPSGLNGSKQVRGLTGNQELGNWIARLAVSSTRAWHFRTLLKQSHKVTELAALT
jgi:hypothetical protein